MNNQMHCTITSLGLDHLNFIFLRRTDLSFLNSRFHFPFFVISLISETSYHQLKFEKKATHFVDQILH